MRKKYYLAACCILKDEDPFIMEWLTYHSLIGVEHFFIYDNESKNPLAKNPLMEKFDAQGKITLLDSPGQAMQLPSYTHCLQNFGPLAKWIAFLDLDEFICPAEGSDIRPMLAAYEDYAALGLNWKCFSSGGHISSPKGLVIKNYRERFLEETIHNLHIKSIVQPDKVNEAHTPHSFYPNDGEMAVNVNFRPIARGMAMIPICWEKATVHHYILKSQQDAQRRIERGRADIKSDRPTLDSNDFYNLVRQPVEMDDSIVRFAPEVEAWLKSGELPEEHSASLSRQEPERLIPLAGELIRQGLRKEAGITLCHAGLTQSGNPALWQTWAVLADKENKDELVKLFAAKAARLKAALPRPAHPPDVHLKALTEKRAEAAEARLKKLMQEHKYAEAEEIVESIAQKNKLTSYLWLIRGELARAGGRLGPAAEYLYNSLIVKENLLAYQALIQVRLDERDYREARRLVFYLTGTQTYRVKINVEGSLIEDESFYGPLKNLYEDLRRITGG